MTLIAFQATDADTVSSVLVSACRIDTGSIAASMMNPMPRIITAKRSSTNENAARRERSRLGWRGVFRISKTVYACPRDVSVLRSRSLSDEAADAGNCSGP